LGEHGIKELGIENVQIREAKGLLEIRLSSFECLVGIIDEQEKVVYLPTLNDMRRRLENLNIKMYSELMAAYTEIGEALGNQGYHRRYISDF
jgi:hypothetical protein